MNRIGLRRHFHHVIVLSKPSVHFHRVELVAAIVETPAATCAGSRISMGGWGATSNCTLGCPTRRGKRRRDVEDDLAMGHIPRGLHPESRLSADARLSPAMSEDTNDDEILRRRAQITVLQDRINRFRELLLKYSMPEPPSISPHTPIRRRALQLSLEGFGSRRHGDQLNDVHSAFDSTDMRWV